MAARDRPRARAARRARHAPRRLRLRGGERGRVGLACLELEAGDSGLRTFVSVQGSLAMTAIHAWGSEEQSRAGCRALAAGEAVGCFALTEPAGRQQPGRDATTPPRRRRLGLDGAKRGSGWASSPTSRSCGPAPTTATAAFSSPPGRRACGDRHRRQARAARLAAVRAALEATVARRSGAARRRRPARPVAQPRRGALRHRLGRHRRGPLLLRGALDTPASVSFGGRSRASRSRRPSSPTGVEWPKARCSRSASGGSRTPGAREQQTASQTRKCARRWRSRATRPPSSAATGSGRVPGHAPHGQPRVGHHLRGHERDPRPDLGHALTGIRVCLIPPTSDCAPPRPTRDRR